ncbi:glycerate kinase [Halobacillus alkaliphilus]|uniref:Glycerate kinase n=1 Tax=Halobacillus alkaliphilus TaxID=396056 RepID=A0A1I2L3R6_9BACI|nr:glycerate kinase [Halobacillus alkaliphilus]SFF73159.1 glycerate kinase [Halobacillus alkaliphilus]
MRIIVAPDSFKGSMSSAKACSAVESGVRSYSPSCDIKSIPIADGGEGTVEAIVKISGGEIVSEMVRDPLGREVVAEYGWVNETKTAIVETAAASGLPRLKSEELNPLKASTYGTGQLIQAALDRGAERIILGLGGSATVDAGTGCFQALGVKYFNDEGTELKMNGEALQHVAKIETQDAAERFKEVEWIIASDVTNPLLGEQGAISVFGPQKGVAAGSLPYFESAMQRYASALEHHTGKVVRDHEGSGAAGGFGFTLFSLLENLHVESGFELIAQLGELENHIKDADLVITGEGKMDMQTFYGKGPIGIGRLARKASVPCIAFTGKSEGDMSLAKEEGISAVLPIVDEPMTLKEAMECGPELLKRASRRFMEIYHLKQQRGEVHK